MRMALSTLTILLVLCIMCPLSISQTSEEDCCSRIPRAMDINTFQSRVATGDEWVEIFFFLCPTDPLSNSEQFRQTLGLQNRVLSRTFNIRFQSGDPCLGPTNDTFNQVGSKRAVFDRQGADGLIREDRYLNTLSLDDYVIFFSCADRANAVKGRCFDYFFSLLMRKDPPENFPWDKAVWELKRYGIDPREFLFTYINEICPV